MRGFLIFLAVAGSIFLDAFLIQWITHTILSPYGQHGYTYAQALEISFALTTSALAGVVMAVIIKLLADD
jgi:hypothetical protein